jgi:hypothetical protein
MPDVFVHETCFSAPPSCIPADVRISESNAGILANGSSSTAVITSNGQLVAFASDASNLVPNDTNGKSDIFLALTGFTLRTVNPLPNLASLSPGSAKVGASDFTLKISGSAFVPESTARWNGSGRVTIFVSSTELLVRVLSSDLVAAGTAQITVFNPTPGGGLSNPLTLVVNP